jgi:hypothetical protein
MKKEYFIGLIALTISSCKKFVEIAPPVNELVTASVFNNSGAATAAQLAIYSQMANNMESFNLSQNSGLLADELTNYSTGTSSIQLYTDAQTAINPLGNWNTTAYNYIYQANAIIEALQNNGNIASAISQQLTGESYFVRAFWHFYLTNMYGPIPIVTTTNYAVNDKIARSPQSQVYAQIVSDLYRAAQLLNTNYVDGSDTTVTAERARPTKWAAYALLARTYLYMGSSYYDSAKACASQVIGNSIFQLGSLQNVFSISSQEAIWQLETPLPLLYPSSTPDAYEFVLTGAPGSGSTNGTVALSQQLLGSFEPGDQRYSNWVDSFPTGGSSNGYYYYVNKYTYNVNNPAPPVTQYVTVLRLAEQYLIRAEAEANLGDMRDAANDLNTVRARAGLGVSPTLTAGSTLQQADSAILHERQVELFVEWGHRWFDLIRTDAISSVMGPPGNVYTYKGGVGSWNANLELYPIPQSEIIDDPNLTQNAGY